MKQQSDGKLYHPTRRRFIQSGTALGLLGASGLALSSGRAEAQTPKTGGHFSLAMTGSATTDTLDPRAAQNDMVYTLLLNVHAYLVDVSPNNELLPELASSWTADPDTSRWIFDLNPDAKFHNGRPVTSADVLASIAFHTSEDSVSGMKGQLSAITEMKADGPNRVIMQLSGRNTDFPYIFNGYQLAIMPATDTGIDWQSGIGAGAYKLDAFEPGVSARLSRNTENWLSGRGWVDTIEINAVNDPNARVQALMSGSANIITNVDARFADRIAGVEGLKLVTNTLRAFYDLPMLTDLAPFNDNNVRLALKYSFDREAFVEKILGGYGSLANDHPIAPSHKYFNTELEQRAYDPEKAKYYLKQSGLDKLTVPFSTSEGAFAGAVDTAALFSETARAAGIELEITREPADGYWTNVWAKKPFIASDGGGRPTEDSILSLAYVTGASWSNTRFSNSRLDELVTNARGEADENLRREMYWEVQAILNAEGGTLIPAYIQSIDGVAANVMHPEALSGTFELDGMRGLQRWWIAD
ncbi:MAG: Dipeptide-binding protein DppE precursor [Pseudomonadota bacterium]